MTSTWWLSFCDANRDTGKQFLGACIVSGADFIDAVRNSHERGCNPGGEVVGKEIPPHIITMIPATMRGVLLNTEQIDKIQTLTLPS